MIKAFIIPGVSIKAEPNICKAAWGMAAPWYVRDAQFDTGQKSLPIHIDFVADSRFAYPNINVVHPVCDTHLNDRRVGHAPN